MEGGTNRKRTIKRNTSIESLNDDYVKKTNDSTDNLDLLELEAINFPNRKTVQVRNKKLRTQSKKISPRNGGDYDQLIKVQNKGKKEYSKLRMSYYNE